MLMCVRIRICVALIFLSFVQQSRQNYLPQPSDNEVIITSLTRAFANLENVLMAKLSRMDIKINEFKELVTDEFRNVNEKFESLQNSVESQPRPQGAPGIPGPKGDKGYGIPGPFGPTGAKGDRGSSGLPGEKGHIGPVGPAGAKGDRGSSGLPGEKGHIGPVGPTGAKGDRGSSGMPGEKGHIGPVGPTGAKGDCGSSSLPGEKGHIGQVGPKGDREIQGQSGSTGPPGERGPQGCPGGSIKLRGSDQCFVFFNDAERSWENGKAKCNAEGLIIARPSDAVAVELRKHLLDKYGEGYAWVGARGVGVKMVWVSDGTEFKQDSHLCYPGWCSHKTVSGTDRCLAIMVDQYAWSREPGRPYYPVPCSTSYFTLCEVNM